MARLEHEGTLDKLSELHTLTKSDSREELVDVEALENAADNLMQHMSGMFSFRSDFSDFGLGVTLE